MINFKKILFAVIISCSIGAMSGYSTIASAANPGAKAMRPNKEVIKDVIEALSQARSKVENDESKETVLDSIQDARQFSKEINVGSLGAIVDRGADSIIACRRSIKAEDKPGSITAISESIKIYEAMANKTL